MPRQSIESIKEPIWKTLVSNLKNNVIFYRQKGAWTQVELAQRAGLNATTIADIEQGKAYNPRIESIALLTKAFDLSDPLALLKDPKKAR